MLIYNFKNYEEFKEIFNVFERGNGVKSRRNNILLSLWKNKEVLHNYRLYKEYIAASIQDVKYRRKYFNAYDHNLENCRRLDLYDKLRNNAEWDFDKYPEKIRHFEFMDEKFLVSIKRYLLSLLGTHALFKGKDAGIMRLNGRVFFADGFYTDDMNGLCEDKTTNAIRYVNASSGKVFKMKAGRMLNHIMEHNVIVRELPYEIQRWLSEQFVSDWIGYTTSVLYDDEYELHVDDNFRDIYDSGHCLGYDEDDDCFGSCMVDKDLDSFYEDAISAKAAYLTDEYGMIVARCILYTDVFDEDDKKWRLAERQYSYNGEEDLKRRLVFALIKEGYIDGYKRVTASCHESKDFVDIGGNSLSDKTFHIACNLGPNETLSYQDTFKYYNVDENVAYNDSSEEHDFCLDVTDGCIGGDYCEHRGETYFERDTRYCQNTRTYEHKDDVMDIDGDYYYAGRNCEDPEAYGIRDCAECGTRFFDGDGGYYSDITEEWYCCDSCREDAENSYKEDNWYWSEYDQDYFENEEDVISCYYYVSYRGIYRKMSISVDMFNALVSRGEATEFCGENYVDNVNYEGEPVHLGVTISISA